MYATDHGTLKVCFVTFDFLRIGIDLSNTGNANLITLVGSTFIMQNYLTFCAPLREVEGFWVVCLIIVTTTLDWVNTWKEMSRAQTHKKSRRWCDVISFQLFQESKSYWFRRRNSRKRTGTATSRSSALQSLLSPFFADPAFYPLTHTV